MKYAPRTLVLAAALAMTTAPGVTRAYVAEAQPAPAFTQQQLDSPVMGQTTPRSLSDYAGKVIFPGSTYPFLLKANNSPGGNMTRPRLQCTTCRGGAL